jgi:hypothetical protein
LNAERGCPSPFRAARWASLALVCLWACAGAPRALDPRPGSGGGSPGDDPSSRLLATVGFDERAEWPSTILHLDASEIGARSNLSTLLRRADRVQLRRPEGTEWGLHLVDAEGENPCPVAVYINGSRFGRARTPGSTMTIDALISLDAVAGLELHEGTEGPVLSVLECGSLMIWSPEADPVYRFFGEITAVVLGSSADRVTSVVLEPGSVAGRREGSYTYFSVLPGEYEVHFLQEGRLLDVRRVRAYAFAESEVSLEVN